MTACVAVSLLLFCVGLVLLPATPAPHPHPRASSGATTPPPDIGRGSLESPCKGTSSYTHARLDKLWVENDPSYAACRDCVGSEKHATECPSQFGTDKFFLLNFWRCRTSPGLYLDVGAHAPKDYSVSWVLDHCLGWQGICVEAAGTLAPAFARQGRTCAVVQRAVSLRTGSGRFVNAGTLVGAIETAGAGDGATAETVNFTTLEDVLVEQGIAEGRGVDFLNVDVEGAELEALASFPFSRNPVAFASVENVAGTRDTFEFLIDSGFVSLGELGVDTLWAGLPIPLLQLTDALPFLRQGHAQLRKNAFGLRQYDSPSLEAWGWLRVRESLAVNKSLVVWGD